MTRTGLAIRTLARLLPLLRRLVAGLRRWESSAALLLIAGAYSLIQAATPNIIGIDGYYHVKVAALMRAQGWRLLEPLDFPWLQLTILGPGRYTDHHFLFHLLQMPFAFGDLRVGAKMAAVLFATVGLYTTYVVLARFRVRYPLLWIMVLLGGASTFLWRQSMARTQSLSLLLMVLGLWALFAGRPRLLLPVGFLAAWLFNGFFFVLGGPAAALGWAVVGRCLPGLASRLGLTALLGAPSAGAPASWATWPVVDRASPSSVGRASGGSPGGEASHSSAIQTAMASSLGPCSETHLAGAEHHLTAAETGPTVLAAAAVSVTGSAALTAAPLPVDVAPVSPPAAAQAATAGREAGDGAGEVGLTIHLALAALAWTLLGIGLGLLLHPYFPRNVEFAFFHLLPKAVPAEQIDVPVGREWYPYSPLDFLTRAGPATALTVLGLFPPAFAVWRRIRPDWRSLVLGTLALGFLAMVVRSQRLIEYFPAFAVLFCAWSWSRDPAHLATAIRDDLARRWPRLASAPRRVPASVAPWLVGAALCAGMVVGVGTAMRQARGGVPWDAYRDGALWLAANTPAGSRVFTTDWDDFPHMFYWDTHNTYLVGLDPTYFSLEDPEKYRLWRAISAGRVERPARVILETFDTPYVLTDRVHEGFLRVAATDPGLEEVMRTRTVVVFRVHAD